jgi:hypothetical protein
MEASFCGNEDTKTKYDFTTTHYMQAGKELCRSLLLYFGLKKEPLVDESNTVKKTPPKNEKLL